MTFTSFLQIRAIPLKKAPPYKKAPPLIRDEILIMGGGFLIRRFRKTRRRRKFLAFWTSDRLGTLQKTCFRRGKRLQNTKIFRLRRAIVQSLRNMTISVCVKRSKISFLARRRRTFFGVLFPHKKALPYKKAPPPLLGE